MRDERTLDGWDDYACYDGRAILKLVSQCLYLIDGVQVAIDSDINFWQSCCLKFPEVMSAATRIDFLL